MKTLKFSIISRLLLVIGLLSGLLFSSPVAAVSPDKSSSAGQPPAVGVEPLLTVPAVAMGVGSPKPDGNCSPTEYSGALSRTFPDGPGGSGTGQIYLIHDATNLYLCIISPVGSNPARFDSLYLDPQGDGATTPYAQADDFSLQLDFTGAKSTWIGTGVANGWLASPNDNALWTGAATIGNYDFAEYQLPLANFGLNVCSSVFRLAGYHLWFAGTGNDYGWPSNQYYDQPGTWQPLQLGSANCGQTGKIAYVFRSNADATTGFYNLLTGAGYTVSKVPLGDILTTDFSVFDLIIIADDTGSLNQWGTPPAASTGLAQVNQITLPNKPILGLGEGGYAFFGRLSMFIGWPHGWHGPQNYITRTAVAPPALFSGLPADPVQIYGTPTNSVGIYLIPSYPADVIPAGNEHPADDHSSLIQQGCNMLWGNSGIPGGMTASPAGILLFLNTVGYTRGQTCPAPTPPPDPACYTLVKTANPADATTVTPGTVITYTLTYSLIKSANCPASGKLVDYIPQGTSFVPGSASDGISLGADGALIWTVFNTTGTATKTFKVQVMDAICTGNKTVANLAELQPSGAAPLTSNTTTHPVTCPPVGFPNTQPTYAEDELKVQPYPLFAGTPSEVSVRLTNSGLSPVAVAVQFQVSPSGIGIGLPYNTFDTRNVTIPASSQLMLRTNYRPTASGLACFQVVVTASGYAAIKTQTCLDTIEDFSGSPPYPPLDFQVGNPTGTTADIMLVVNNTCPGWSAVITTPSGGVLTAVGPNSSDLRSASLQVTPPSPVFLGSGCHIDVEGWIINPGGDAVLIGGIRKLDLPPVHLPTNVLPPWEEPEITFVPEIPVAGSPGQICIQLQNPLDVPKVVTVNFSVADFGAGIGFTPAASLTGITLPAHSFAKYCAPWTPAVSGTLHRCVLATLVQTNTMDQVSQKNIDIARPVTGGDLGSLAIPFMAGNPGLADRLLSFEFNLVGIDPLFSPYITNPGGTLFTPMTLLAGGSVPLVLHFSYGVTSPTHLAPQLPASYGFGDLSSVEVSVLLDGIRESGFSIYMEPYRLFLPLIRR